MVLQAMAFSLSRSSLLIADTNLLDEVAIPLWMAPKGSCLPNNTSEWLCPDGNKASPTYLRNLQQAVIGWWLEHQRSDLPWRNGPATASRKGCRAGVEMPNPYHIWVSEVMSQQTQMGTVIRYFTTWMEKFPTIEALSQASEEDVRSVWSGMGYYRRAMYLHRGAAYLVERHKQQHFSSTSPVTMPESCKELRDVPGVGPYTAAAIASICFGEPAIAVDGNVVRVLSRIRKEEQFDPKNSNSLKAVSNWGQLLMTGCNGTEPGAVNQGLMEIGASVCRPSGAPRCGECPLRSFCGSYRALTDGRIQEIEGVIPLRATPPKKREESVVCVVHELPAGDDGKPRFVVLKRPLGGLLGGMLEFPSITVATENASASKRVGSAHPTCGSHSSTVSTLSCAKACREMKHVSPPTVGNVGKIKHIFSHISMTVDVFHIQWNEEQLACFPLYGGTPPVMGASSPAEQAICNELQSVAVPGSDTGSINILSSTEIVSGACSRLLRKIIELIPSAKHCLKRPR